MDTSFVSVVQNFKETDEMFRKSSTLCMFVNTGRLSLIHKDEEKKVFDSVFFKGSYLVIKGVVTLGLVGMYFFSLTFHA